MRPHHRPVADVALPLTLVGLSLVAGCSDDTAAKEHAASIVLNTNLPGILLSECMDAVGYMTDPAYVAENVITAPGDGWYRVAFQNEDDSSTFIHVGVHPETGTVVAYKDEDETALDTSGCSVGNRTPPLRPPSEDAEALSSALTLPGVRSREHRSVCLHTVPEGTVGG